MGVSSKCPDLGTCHHNCGSACFRVRFCAPLSNYGDVWPPSVVESKGGSGDDDEMVRELMNEELTHEPS